MAKKSKLGELISRKVKEKRIPVKEFAAMIGMKKGNYYRVLEKESLDVSFLLKLSGLLDIPLELLLDQIPGYRDHSVTVTTSGDSNQVNTTVGGYGNAAITALEAELSACRELVRAKDTIIKLLEDSNVK